MIVLKNLSKKYGAVQVLKNLDLEVNKGETLVILGRSGVGKSVLLRHILGIEIPDSGTVEIEGQDLNKISHKARIQIREQMGMLFQFGALFDSMSVGENVAFYLRQHPENLSEKELQQRVAEALEMVDLAGIQNKMPSDLSGGMKKRAALARVIVYKPHIILYDEPTTGLDPITAMQIDKLIIQIQNELKGTSIVVTHDIRSAMEVGDRLAFHDEGRISHIAPKRQFLKIKDPQILAFFSNATLNAEYLKDMEA